MKTFSISEKINSSYHSPLYNFPIREDITITKKYMIASENEGKTSYSSQSEKNLDEMGK